MGLMGSKGSIRPITFFLAPMNLGWAKHYNHGSMGHPPAAKTRHENAGTWQRIGLEQKQNTNNINEL